MSGPKLRRREASSCYKDLTDYGVVASQSTKDAHQPDEASHGAHAVFIYQHYNNMQEAPVWDWIRNCGWLFRQLAYPRRRPRFNVNCVACPAGPATDLPQKASFADPVSFLGVVGRQWYLFSFLSLCYRPFRLISLLLLGFPYPDNWRFQYFSQMLGASYMDTDKRCKR